MRLFFAGIDCRSDYNPRDVTFRFMGSYDHGVIMGSGLIWYILREFRMHLIQEFQTVFPDCNEGCVFSDSVCSCPGQGGYAARLDAQRCTDLPHRQSTGAREMRHQSAVVVSTPSANHVLVNSRGAEISGGPRCADRVGHPLGPAGPRAACDSSLRSKGAISKRALDETVMKARNPSQSGCPGVVLAQRSLIFPGVTVYGRLRLE